MEDNGKQAPACGVRRGLMLLGKLVLFIVGAVATVLAVSLSGWLDSLPDGDMFLWVDEAVLLASVCLPAWLIVRFFDKRPFLRSMGFLLPRRNGLGMWAAAVVAALMLVGGFGCSLLVGWVSIDGVSPNARVLLCQFLLMILVALTEELMMRGFVMGQMLQAGVNGFATVLITSVFFGLMHAGNAAFSAVPFVNITLLGALLGVFRLCSGSLWPPIVFHLAWNWLQGAVLGYAVSGGDAGVGFFSIELRGGELATGGAFGFEGSLLCTVFSLIAIVGVLYINMVKGGKSAASSPRKGN